MADEKKETVKRRWLLYPYRLTHHPLCEEFSDHVYHIKGHKVCRGCVNMYLGMMLGVILAPIAIFVLNINYWIAFISTNIFYIFTPISVLLNPPRKVKDVFRLLLGVAMISMIVTIILSIIEQFSGFNPWALVVMLVSILIYIVSKRYFTRLRSRRNERVCRECDQFYLPRCEGMEQKLSPEEIDSKTLDLTELSEQ